MSTGAPVEDAILSVLSGGELVPHNQILASVWGIQSPRQADIDMLQCAIIRLRRKLGDNAITTRRGMGYILEVQMCPCGCKRPVRPGKKYAERQCSNRLYDRRKRQRIKKVKPEPVAQPSLFTSALRPEDGPRCSVPGCDKVLHGHYELDWGKCLRHKQAGIIQAREQKPSVTGIGG